MAKDLVRITTDIPAPRPDWVRPNSTVSFPLNRDQMEQLASACDTFRESKDQYATVEVHFIGALRVMLAVTA